MHWDSLNNILYIYNEGAWKTIYGSTSWTNITVNTPTYAASGSVPQYRIIGDIVYLRGAFASTGMTAGSAATCGQLPAAAYPAQTTVYPGSTSQGAASVNKISITSAGALSITPEIATGSHYINFSYPLG